MKLTEKLKDLKQKRDKLIKTGLEVQGEWLFTDIHKKSGRWSNRIIIDPELAPFFASLLNFYSKVLADHVKKTVTDQVKAIKVDLATSNLTTASEKVVDIESLTTKLDALKQLKTDNAPLLNLTAFEFEANDQGITIVNGFPSANQMIVEYLQANPKLVDAKFDEFVEAMFTEQVAIIKADAQAVLVEIGK